MNCRLSSKTKRFSIHSTLTRPRHDALVIHAESRSIPVIRQNVVREYALEYFVRCRHIRVLMLKCNVDCDSVRRFLLGGHQRVALETWRIGSKGRSEAAGEVSETAAMGSSVLKDFA